MEIGPEHAIAHYRRLIDEVKMVNGNFISLWHNDSLNDQKSVGGLESCF